MVAFLFFTLHSLCAFLKLVALSKNYPKRTEINQIAVNYILFYPKIEPLRGHLGKP